MSRMGSLYDLMVSMEAAGYSVAEAISCIDRLGLAHTTAFLPWPAARERGLRSEDLANVIDYTPVDDDWVACDDDLSCAFGGAAACLVSDVEDVFRAIVRWGDEDSFEKSLAQDYQLENMLPNELRASAAALEDLRSQVAEVCEVLTHRARARTGSGWAAWVRSDLDVGRFVNGSLSPRFHSLRYDAVERAVDGSGELFVCRDVICDASRYDGGKSDLDVVEGEVFYLMAADRPLGHLASIPYVDAEGCVATAGEVLVPEPYTWYSFDEGICLVARCRHYDDEVYEMIELRRISELHPTAPLMQEDLRDLFYDPARLSPCYDLAALAESLALAPPSPQQIARTERYLKHTVIIPSEWLDQDDVVAPWLANGGPGER